MQRLPLPARLSAGLSAGLAIGLPALLLTLVSCVSVEPEVDEPNTRGDRRFPAGEVIENADNLRVGLTEIQVFLLLGTPSERDRSTNTWVYLPNRSKVSIGDRALRLKFKNGRLVDFGYHVIVLKQRL